MLYAENFRKSFEVLDIGSELGMSMFIDVHVLINELDMSILIGLHILILRIGQHKSNLSVDYVAIQLQRKFDRTTIQIDVEKPTLLFDSVVGSLNGHNMYLHTFEGNECPLNIPILI